MKKFICMLLCCFLLAGIVCTETFALHTSDVLGYSFSGDKKYLKIFFNGKVSDDDKITITQKRMTSEVTANVPVRTTFLVDNTVSFPSAMREPIKKSIVQYMRQMDTAESIRLAIFDKSLTSLTDNYTRDAEMVAMELDSIQFNRQGSFIYDAIQKAIVQFFADDNAYYRLVVVTDGVPANSGGSISFDYLQNMIANDNRYHIDFIQVGGTDKPRENINMKSLSMLSSNTFHMFYEGHTDLQYLVQKEVSLMKVPMTNELMTGEYRGIAIGEGTALEEVGKVYFPQSDLSSEPAVSGQDSGQTVMLILIIAAAVIAAALAGVGIFFLIKKNKKEKAVVIGVCIIKEDQRDKVGRGPYQWVFLLNEEFKVGRTLHPVGSENKTMGTNDFAIIETADPSRATGIGRNAFSLRYAERDKSVIIHNTAQKACFFIQEGDREPKKLKPQEECRLGVQMNILIGNYTTVRVESIQLGGYTKKELRSMRGI